MRELRMSGSVGGRLGDRSAYPTYGQALNEKRISRESNCYGTLHGEILCLGLQWVCIMMIAKILFGQFLEIIKLFVTGIPEVLKLGLTKFWIK